MLLAQALIWLELSKIIACSASVRLRDAVARSRA
jgi:hypothetical protein